MAHQIRITPSILNADFANLGAEIERISLTSDLVHLDVMDDIFVPNFTFDFAHASEIISISKLPVDAHLMVAAVDQIAPKYAEVGCASVTIHAEATTDIRGTLKAIRSNGARASLALKPKTPLDPYL
jgi:ribulose-phosphate 3-epimerase